MGLSQLAEKCRVCPFVSKCDRKRMEALAYFSEPAMPTITTEAVGNEPIIIPDSCRISAEDAIKVFNDFAKQACLHKMGFVRIGLYYMNHFKLWNEWQKRSLNGPAYKLLVLLGLAHSPTFEVHCLLADIDSF